MIATSAAQNSNAYLIIPARGGSKGILRKNVAPLGGMPLIAHLLRSAGHSSITKSFVSTDDSEIAQVARTYGAEVIDRPAEMATDAASSESAILHALEVIQKSEGALPKWTVFGQCTSPFTTAADLDAALLKVCSGKFDCVFAATPAHAFLWGEKEDGTVEGLNHDKSKRVRRQDLLPQYQETGAFYIFDSERFLMLKHRFFGRIGLQLIPNERSVDIDEPLDLEYAEFLLKSLAAQR